MKKKKQSTSKLLKTVGEKMLLSPLKLGSKLAHGTFCNSPFITPAARVKIKLACKSKLTARVKRLATNHKQVGVNRKSSGSVKSRAIAFNSSVTSIAVEQPPTVEQECGGNVTKKLQSNKRKFSETCSSKGYPCLHIHTQDPMPTTSKNMDSSPIVHCTKGKVPNVPAKGQSFVHDIFASKITKSTKKKRNNSAEVKIPKRNLLKKTTEINVPTNRPQKSSDDVVTKYLKKFKGSMSPKKRHSNDLSQNIQTVSKSSKNSGKGKGLGKKSKNEDRESPNSDKGGNITNHLPILKEHTKKGSKVYLQDESVFKRPTKPVGGRKRTSNKACKNAKLNLDDDTSDDNKKSSKNPSNINKSKSDERKVLRSSRR